MKNKAKSKVKSNKKCIGIKLKEKNHLNLLSFNWSPVEEIAMQFNPLG